MSDRDRRTIDDFGEQWAAYPDNDGYYGSVALLGDIVGPLLDLSSLEGARVGDVGSGSGRIVRMLLDAGAASVIAVEPSAGVDALRENTRDVADRVEIIHGDGTLLPTDRELDLVFSIGVLQFVEDAHPVVETMFRSLRPGGSAIVWLYAKEGTIAYRFALGALRAVTTRIPHRALVRLCKLLDRMLDPYIAACRRVKLPLGDYLLNTFARVSREKRELTLYDQLNPRYVRFHTRAEARALLESAGFEQVTLHHRRGYSWTVLGRRPRG